MMYLVVKTCSDSSHRSCGCQNKRFLSVASDVLTKTERFYNPQFPEERVELSSTFTTSTSGVDYQDFISGDLKKLETGIPIRLTKSVSGYQGKITSYD